MIGNQIFLGKQTGGAILIRLSGPRSGKPVPLSQNQVDEESFWNVFVLKWSVVYMFESYIYVSRSQKCNQMAYDEFSLFLCYTHSGLLSTIHLEISHTLYKKPNVCTTTYCPSHTVLKYPVSAESRSVFPRHSRPKEPWPWSFSQRKN